MKQMNKQEYLTAIREKIKAMPAEDIERFTDYYSEMIDDRMMLLRIWWRRMMR